MTSMSKSHLESNLESVTEKAEHYEGICSTMGDRISELQQTLEVVREDVAYYKHNCLLLQALCEQKNNRMCRLIKSHNREPPEILNS